MNGLDRYPIGSYVISTKPTTRIERVVAHLRGQWLGGAIKSPWLGLATEVVVPKEPRPEPRLEAWLEGKEVIAGEIPDSVANVHCVTSMALPSVTPVDEAKIMHHGHMTVITWGTCQYLILQIDMGDPQVGINGGAMVFGTGGFAIDGYPELLVAELFGSQHDPTDWIQQPHLFSVVNWLTETAVCPSCGRRDNLHPLDGMCRECEAFDPRDLSACEHADDAWEEELFTS